jgi:hydrogenase maturation protein HypF
LFDAAAAMLGVAEKTSFEGQGPMWLESLAAGEGAAVPLPLERDRDGIWRSDWAPLVKRLMDATEDAAPPSVTVAERATDFHASLARALLDQVTAVASEHRFDAVGLTGGVFQNQRLCERVLPMLAAAGHAAYLPEALPCNDAGLAFGQIIHLGSQA